MSEKWTWRKFIEIFESQKLFLSKKKLIVSDRLKQKIKIVFPDTNIFLHYMRLDDINWLEILDAKSVIIVILPVVIAELNKIKDFPQYNWIIRNRAGDLLINFKEINDSRSYEIRKDVSIYFDSDPLKGKNKPEFNMLPNDDLFIASVLKNKKKYHHEEIIAITSDSYLLLHSKLNNHNIKSIQLDKKYKLPIEVNPLEKQIQELKLENEQLKNQFPNLSLFFVNGKNHFDIHLEKQYILTDTIINDVLNKVKSDFPKIELPDNQKLGLSHFENQIKNLFIESIYTKTISYEDQVKQYNKKLDEHYQKYVTIFKKNYEIKNISKRIIPINLMIENNGKIPGDKIDIYIEFQPDIKILFEDYRNKDIPYPEVPKKPEFKNRALDIKEESISAIFTRTSLDIPDIKELQKALQKQNVSEPEIIYKKDKCEVIVHVDKVKHKASVNLGKFYIIFNSYECTNSFSFKYVLHADNFPNKIEGELHLKIDKEN